MDFDEQRHKYKELSLIHIYPSTLYLHVFPKDLASSKSGVTVDGGIRIFIPCDGIDVYKRQLWEVL